MTLPRSASARTEHEVEVAVLLRVLEDRVVLLIADDPRLAASITASTHAWYRSWSSLEAIYR